MTKGVLKRGYLHKFRDREISFASKWGLRYFVLQGSTISYYADDRELRPRRTISLEGCIVRDEGLKKERYNIFSIFWPSQEDPDEPGNLLLRFSTELKDEAAQWIRMLERACRADDDAGLAEAAFADGSDWATNFDTSTTNASIALNKGVDHNVASETEVVHLPLPADIDTNVLPLETLKRVQSSSLILQRSQSRRFLHGEVKEQKLPAPSETPQSKVRPDSAAALPAKGPERPKPPVLSLEMSSTSTQRVPVDHKRRRFPASKPIHIESKPSPLSSDVRPGEQNYRGFFNLVRTLQAR